jgi:hypothetical protein
MDNVHAALTSFRPISMETTNRIARLQERVDRKYLIRRDLFPALAEELADAHFVMELDGRQVLLYDTIYFDTDELLCYRSALQGRRIRFKVRSRRYLDSGSCVFELKYKDHKGMTVKERIDYPWQTHGIVDREASAFVAATLLLRYDMDFADELSRALDVSFRRVTLVNADAGQRITCDFDLAFRSVDGGETQMDADYMIVETKGDFAPSLADRLLRRHGQRPVSCSKYCVGVGSSDPRVKNNPFRPVLRRYFTLQDGRLTSAWVSTTDLPLERKPSSTVTPLTAEALS